MELEQGVRERKRSTVMVKTTKAKIGMKAHKYNPTIGRWEWGLGKKLTYILLMFVSLNDRE